MHTVSIFELFPRNNKWKSLVFVFASSLTRALKFAQKYDRMERRMNEIQSRTACTGSTVSCMQKITFKCSKLWHKIKNFCSNIFYLDMKWGRYQISMSNMIPKLTSFTHLAQHPKNAKIRLFLESPTTYTFILSLLWIKETANLKYIKGWKLKNMFYNFNA